MDRTSDRDIQDGAFEVLAVHHDGKPQVQTYDPHFGQSLFERLESFFRRYEAPDQPLDASE